MTSSENTSSVSNHTESSNTASTHERLSIREKIAYGLGTFGDQLTTNAINQTVRPIFNIVLGLSPTLIGSALMVGKLIDAFTDPLMGAISDNTRTRWGRRRPYIFWGSFSCALAFPLIWFVPQAWGQWGMMAYLVVTLTLIAILSTIYSVPWTALGMEMTPDYHERTQVMVYRTLLTKGIWFVIPWFWAWSQCKIFSNPVIGMRWIGLGVSVVTLLSGLACFAGCKERYYKAAKSQAKVKLSEAAGITLRNKPFLIVLLITLVQVIGIATTVGGLTLYVSTYWVYDGDLGAGATMAASLGTMKAIVGLLVLPLISFLARRIGKKATMGGCLGLAFIGSILNWFCFSRNFPMLQIIPAMFFAPSMTAFWLINGSMRADVVDHDEMQTGSRREGIYGSIGRWFEKLAFAGSLLLSGIILDLVGFDALLKSNQAPETLLNMRIAFAVIPALAMLAGLYLVKIYPLTERVMQNYRIELEKRRGQI